MCTTDIANAEIIPSKTARFGDTITVKCDIDYKLNGNSHITCNTNRTFSDVPTCEPQPDCTAVSWRTLDIKHSKPPDNLPVPYSTEITVWCIEKYSTNAVVKCNTNGQFTYTEPKPSCYAGMSYVLINK